MKKYEYFLPMLALRFRNETPMEALGLGNFLVEPKNKDHVSCFSIWGDS